MKLKEYQGKLLLQRAGIKTPAGRLITRAAQAVEAVQALPAECGVLKSQIMTGGRGKVGGIGFFGSVEEAVSLSEKMLGASLRTKQSLNAPEKVDLLLVEERISYQHAFYLAAMFDWASGRCRLLFHPEGGEEVETADVSKLHRLELNRELEGLADFAELTLQSFTRENALLETWTQLLTKVCRLFLEKDCLLLEINPCVLTEQGEIMALDCKMEIDDNALFRQPGIRAEFCSPDPINKMNFVPLGGNVGCVANGAGLAMATMDIVSLFGGKPACFMDIGGRATAETISIDLNQLTSVSGLKCVLINIFGGIVRCDIAARGILRSKDLLSSGVSIYIRMQGAFAHAGMQLLASSEHKLFLCETIEDAARRSVAHALEESV